MDPADTCKQAECLGPGTERNERVYKKPRLGKKPGLLMTDAWYSKSKKKKLIVQTEQSGRGGRVDGACVLGSNRAAQ